MLNGFALLSLKTCHSQSPLVVTLHNRIVTWRTPAPPSTPGSSSRCSLQAPGLEVSVKKKKKKEKKVAAVIQEDHCPSLRSFYFIVRRFGLGNAFQYGYIRAVTGTDVDLSSV